MSSVENEPIESETFQEKIEDYPYLYETHFHTNGSSACGKSSPEDMIRACKEYGYTGVVVTEHNWGGNTCIDRNLPWETFVDEFVKSYDRAKAVGDEVGVDVFLGYEAGYNGTEFLIYGLTKDYMKAHPELKTCSVEEQFDIVHNGGGIVVHAHPFREEDYIPEIRLFPDYVDGVEGINVSHITPLRSSHNNPDYDVKAIAYARKHNKPMTCGSDIHSDVLFGGGIRTKKKLNNIKEFIELILSGKDYVLYDGENIHPAR